MFRWRCYARRVVRRLLVSVLVAMVVGATPACGAAFGSRGEASRAEAALSETTPDSPASGIDLDGPAAQPQFGSVADVERWLEGYGNGDVGVLPEVDSNPGSVGQLPTTEPVAEVSGEPMPSSAPVSPVVPNGNVSTGDSFCTLVQRVLRAGALLFDEGGSIPRLTLIRAFRMLIVDIGAAAVLDTRPGSEAIASLTRDHLVTFDAAITNDEYASEMAAASLTFGGWIVGVERECAAILSLPVGPLTVPIPTADEFESLLSGSES